MRYYTNPAFSSVLALVFLFSLAACGGGETNNEAADDNGSTVSEEAGLSPAELENGIGPVKSLEMGAIDDALVQQGEEIFNLKCTACHKLDQRYVGPPLGDVLAHRKPEYIMNMMLNPEEMLKKHPEAKAMLAQYMTQMPNQNLTEADARAVLEYLRKAQTENPGA